MITVLMLADNRDRPQQAETTKHKSEREQLARTEHLADICRSLDADKYIFIFQGQNEHHSYLKDVAQSVAEKATILYVEGATQGTSCTALLGIGHIDNDHELLILNGRFPFDLDVPAILKEFRAAPIDAGCATYAPLLAALNASQEGGVFPADKKFIDPAAASAGLTWFARGHSFVKMTQETIRKDRATNGSFHIACVLNEMLDQNLQVGCYALARPDDDLQVPVQTISDQRKSA